MNRTEITQVAVGSGVLIVAAALGPTALVGGGSETPGGPAEDEPLITPREAFDDAGSALIVREVEIALAEGAADARWSSMHGPARTYLIATVDETRDGVPLIYSIAHFAGGMVPDRTAAEFLGADAPWIDLTPPSTERPGRPASSLRSLINLRSRGG